MQKAAPSLQSRAPTPPTCGPRALCQWGFGHGAEAWATPGALAGRQPCLCPSPAAGLVCGAPFSSSQASLGTLRGIPTILLRPGLEGFCRKDGRLLGEAPRKQGTRWLCWWLLMASRPQLLSAFPPLHPLWAFRRPATSGPFCHPIPSGPPAALMHLKAPHHPGPAWSPPSPANLPRSSTALEELHRS